MKYKPAAFAIRTYRAEREYELLRLGLSSCCPTWRSI